MARTEPPAVPSPVRDPTLAHRLQHLGYRGLLAFLGLLPEGLAHRIGAGLGWVAGVVLGVRRATVRRHLEMAFPEKDRAWRRKVLSASYRHLGRESLATFLLARLSREDVLRRTEPEPPEGFRAFQEALEKGRGVILVSAHFGNWEIGGAAMAARGIPMDVVVQRQRNPLFDLDINRTRARLGMRVIPRGSAPREVLRSLRRGRVAAIVADQNVNRGGVFVDFFGVPASTARGAAIFALRAECPIFLGLCRRVELSPPRYRFSLVPVHYTPTGDQEEDVLRLTEAHTRHLEEEVRVTPEQYLWQHRRWKKRPPAGQDAGEGPHRSRKQEPG